VRVVAQFAACLTHSIRGDRITDARRVLLNPCSGGEQNLEKAQKQTLSL
jgi:hypothetical protein